VATTRRTFTALPGLGGLTVPESVERVDLVNRAADELNAVRPRIVRHDITGDGTDEYPLPATWERGFSYVIRVEWRESADFNEPPRYLRDDEYAVEYDDSDAAVIRFATDPSSADKVIVEIAARHTLDDSTSTLEPRDEPAFHALVESLVLAAAARHALGLNAQSHDGLVDPNIERSRELRAESAAARARWNAHMGIGGDAGGAAAGGSTVKAGIALADFDPGREGTYGLGDNVYRHTRRRSRY